MLNDTVGFAKVYIVCGYTDIRRGIDGLAGIIKEQIEMYPFSAGTLFLFCGRITDRIKGLLCRGGCMASPGYSSHAHLNPPPHSTKSPIFLTFSC